MSVLYSSDVAASGIYRAFVVKPVDSGRSHVYIPSLHSKLMPFLDPANPSGGIVEGCEVNYRIANGVWWADRVELKVGDAVYHWRRKAPLPTGFLCLARHFPSTPYRAPQVTVVHREQFHREQC